MANGCLAQGGKVIGIMPKLLLEWEAQHAGLTELIITEDMHERKKILYEKIKNYQLGAGVFARVWPVEQFFIQIQPEYNRTWTSANNQANGVRASTSFGATSILGGIGYGKHNADGMSYFSVMIDLLNADQSPYKIGQARAQPIIRAGAGFPIFRKKKKAD